MTRFFLLFITLTLSAQSPAVDELKRRIYEFEKHYDVFFRKLYGCPAKGQLSDEVCKPGQGTIDYRAFELSGRAAKKLFP